MHEFYEVHLMTFLVKMQLKSITSTGMVNTADSIVFNMILVLISFCVYVHIDCHFYFYHPGYILTIGMPEDLWSLALAFRSLHKFVLRLSKLALLLLC